MNMIRYLEINVTFERPVHSLVHRLSLFPRPCPRRVPVVPPLHFAYTPRTDSAVSDSTVGPVSSFVLVEPSSFKAERSPDCVFSAAFDNDDTKEGSTSSNSEALFEFPVGNRIDGHMVYYRTMAEAWVSRLLQDTVSYHFLRDSKFGVYSFSPLSQIYDVNRRHAYERRDQPLWRSAIVGQEDMELATRNGELAQLPVIFKDSNTVLS